MVSANIILVAIAAGAAGLFQIFKPRLPPYSMQILNFPIPSYVDGGLMTQLKSRVRLHNDNYVSIDVIYFAIDMFQVGWNGNLVHLGRVFDHKRPHSSTECIQDKECRKEHELDKAVWAMDPRSDFETIGSVYTTMEPMGLISSLPNIIWNLFKSGGSMVIPTTGVMLIKASSSTPVTMSMICDNSLNIWTLLMVGVECSLNSIDVGWLPLDKTIDKLQVEALSSLKANATGGVLEHHKPRGAKKKGFDKVLAQLGLNPSMKYS